MNILVDSIKSKLRKFDDYISRFTRTYSDENQALYEHWIDCRYDIEKVVDTNNSKLNIVCPCKPGDIVYVVDTDEKLFKPLHVQYRTVECILVTHEGEVLIKGDYYDDIICHSENLVTSKPYLDYYRCFLTEEAANKFIHALNAERTHNQAGCSEFLHNRSDTVSVWKCPQCGHTFTTNHNPGVLEGTDVLYCCKCGYKFNWNS